MALMILDRLYQIEIQAMVDLGGGCSWVLSWDPITTNYVIHQLGTPYLMIASCSPRQLYYDYCLVY